ncbi:double-strand break repair helicase AddA [Salinarimonas sp.]|uniref:double-strand break repair helicase AddA n=1 Tax=Salinarimonas sp. TaxID=2766526 RepID=UPI00391D13F1
MSGETGAGGPVPPIIAETTARQRRAADPARSAWVSANAGAGKTKVLVDRVLRLMLAGTPPGRILCLTFTKAAAANMAIRVYETLARWVVAEDAALDAALAALDGAAPDPERRAAARRLFARAVETPGGLKIETIHAFCERLLHLAPFEANVPARFSVLDDAQSDELAADALGRVLARARGGDAALADAFRTVSLVASGDRLAAILAQARRHAGLLGDEAAREAALSEIARALGLAPGEDEASLVRAMLDEGIPRAERLAIAEALAATGKAIDAEQAQRLREAASAPDDVAALGFYLCVFFKEDGRGEPRADSRLATKAAGAATLERLRAEQARLVALADKRKAAAALARTRALFGFAAAIEAEIAAGKRRLGALDFDDLIGRTLALLRRGDGAWLLYKLDRGIDHVLVDEAQDTNPEQWEVLRHITADFHAGAGAAGERVRTIFAVGDPKQSIYSFQGADPRAFEASRLLWRARTAAIGHPFDEVPLTVSFRSTPRVLEAVDAVFARPEHAKGLDPSDRPVGTVHQSARPGAPGLVELWPVVRPAAREEPDAWTHPVDAVEDSAPAIVVARTLARAIRTWITTGDANGRVRRPGDVLVLVRKRNAAFLATIKACKDLGIPVAGADRLVISEHIAVSDLLAVGRAALLPDDDLTLACALKTPLVALTDDDLVRIAVGRGETSLARALVRAAEAGDEAAARGARALARWQELAPLGPFGFYAALVGPEGGRRALVARLGAEAGDAIDAFVGLARDSEAPLAPSLGRFLAGFEGVTRELKRDLESGADEVRVMTVHGAKGLEAPVVVVLDDCGARAGSLPGLLSVAGRDGTPLPVWSPGKDHDCAALAAARAAMQERQAEETNRLLYVALTRAKDHLVVAPFLNRAEGDEPDAAWAAMVRRALVETSLDGAAAEEATLAYGEALLWRDPPGARSAAGTQAQTGAGGANSAAADARTELPAWATRPVAPEREPAPPLRPSSALAAADRRPRPADRPFVAQARLAGTLTHALIERLPRLDPASRARAAQAFVAARAPSLPEERRARIVGSALAIIAEPALAPLFAPDALAEAPVAGRVLLPGGATLAISGQIDRLAITPEAVHFVDFKTAARPPAEDAPIREGTLRQMALYAALLSRAFPGRRIEALVVWTAGPLVRRIPDRALAEALARIAADAA